MKKNIGFLANMALIISGGYESLDGGNKLRPEHIQISKKEPPVPKGCTRFYFDKKGECNKGDHLVFFDALKKEKAISKWEKWINLNHQK